MGEGVSTEEGEKVGASGVLDTVWVSCGESVRKGEDDLVDNSVADTAGDRETLSWEEGVRD